MGIEFFKEDRNKTVSILGRRLEVFCVYCFAVRKCLMTGHADLLW